MRQDAVRCRGDVARMPQSWGFPGLGFSGNFVYIYIYICIYMYVCIYIYM